MQAKMHHLIRTAAVLGWACTATGLAQTVPTPAGSPVRIVIPSLANDTAPSDLDYQGGECEVSTTGQTMDCDFQQVFLTVSPFDAQTCLVTTNRYSRHFEKTGEGIWSSREGPAGACGLLDVTTLTDEGNGRRWSLELRKTITSRDAPACQGTAPQTEVLSWRNVRRPLPCRFVQPGALR